MRTRGDANAFVPRPSTQSCTETDADTPLYWVRDYRTLIQSVTYGERVIAEWFGTFGLVALLLAGAGLYGVMAFSVGQRIREESGVRRALGAPDTRACCGASSRGPSCSLRSASRIGLVLGIPFARVLTGSLTSIHTDNAGVVGGVVAVLIAAALLATAIPARRAMRVDPMVALRHE